MTYATSAERGLWSAVIRQALEDLVRARGPEFRLLGENPRPGSRPRVVAEVRGWFFSGGEDFQLVCQRAGVEATAVEALARKALYYRTHDPDALAGLPWPRVELGEDESCRERT